MTKRQPTAIDQIAEDFFTQDVALHPLNATYLGVDGRHDAIDDFSPAGHEASVALKRETLARLDSAEPVDDVDRVTVAAMRERLGLAVERFEAGVHLHDLNVIASPLQEIRDVVDLMPTANEADVRTIATRLSAIPAAVEGYFESLALGASKGLRAPRRQVEKVALQCDDAAADGGFYDALPGRLKAGDTDPSAETATALREGAEAARQAYARAAERLRAEFLPEAPESDACGIEAYRLASRDFLGAEVDLEETYRWGQEELARITRMMEETAEQIAPGQGIKGAVAALNADPRYQLHGTDALQAWMQEKADAAIADLADVHFDVPEPVRTIECMIAPTQTGGIYYTGPSADFSRPGRMWWSVPPGVEQFGTWQELTTVYHEGVPGHHLQVAQTTFRSELLNSWRRMSCWTSGHGEGWALYSEWLMADLGYMDDPGDRMGLLDAQALRAARVVLDIGVHCGFEAPASVGGGEWTYDKAWEFLNAHINMEEGFVRFELDRYLGWPGQAPSYKIGERLWMQLRDECREREGEAFSLKEFHRRALDLGGLGLDTLRSAVLGEL